MVVSIMQPYLLPYIGYFQLIRQSDLFIIHDDVQYIKGGWVNRNRILLNGRPQWITMPVTHASHILTIMERQYAEFTVSRSRILGKIEAAYRSAPLFGHLFRFLWQILMYDDPNVAAFNTHLLKQISTLLGISTPVLLSSSLQKDDRLRGQERVIGICKCVGATQYVNPIGGVALYEAARFARDNIKLSFLKSAAGPYNQFGRPPVPLLSIVDVMMFNDAAALCRALGEFELV